MPGLRLEQFTVMVDGTERKAVSLQFVRAAKQPPGAATTSPGAEETSTPTLALDRRFVFVVDRDGMPSGEPDARRAHAVRARRFDGGARLAQCAD